MGAAQRINIEFSKDQWLFGGLVVGGQAPYGDSVIGNRLARDGMVYYDADYMHH